jgi:hypothetical protein
MPRVAIPITRVNRGGVTLTTVAGDPANDHYIAAGGNLNIVLVVRNNDTSPATVQLPIAKQPDGQPVTPRSVTVAANTTVYVGPFTQDYLQPDGTIHVNVEDSTISLGVIST